MAVGVAPSRTVAGATLLASFSEHYIEHVAGVGRDKLRQEEERRRRYLWVLRGCRNSEEHAPLTLRQGRRCGVDAVGVVVRAGVEQVVGVSWIRKEFRMVSTDLV